MENLLVATFQDKDETTKSLSKLTELNEIDDIMIYNIVMIQKKGDRFQTLYHEGPDTQDLPAEEAAVGTLIGALAGPLGMGLGMLTGVMAGAVGEDDTQNFYDEILGKVSRQLQSGSYAIVIDVEEDDPVIINSYLEPYRAMTTRTDIAEECNRYDQQQLGELNKEIDAEEEKLKTATEEGKLAIKAKIDDLKAERDKRNKKHKSRMENLKKQIRERIEGVNKKIKTANDKRKERLKAHKEKLEEKLNQASEDVAWVYL
jgi:uncharacterized membrane protein